VNRAWTLRPIGGTTPIVRRAHPIFSEHDERQREQAQKSFASCVLPLADQFESWREACAELVYAVTPEREAGVGFRGGIHTRSVGCLDVVDVRCEGHRVERRAEDIARAPGDTYCVYLQVGGSAWFRQGERHLLASRGDIVLADPNFPFMTGALGDFDFRLLRVPRASVDRYLAVPERLPMVHLRFDSAECALLSSCLFGLWAHGARLDARIAEPVADTLVRLIATTAGIAPELADAGREAAHAALLARAERLVAERYAEPELSPGAAAKALGVSLRKLHLLFAASGKTFGESLSERRVTAARELLLAAAPRPVADVASAVGFHDLSTFYRAFRARFGMTPGNVRECATTSRRTDAPPPRTTTPSASGASPAAPSPRARRG